MVREVYLYVRSGVRRGRDRHGLGARKEHVREWSSQRFCARLLLEMKSLLLSGCKGRCNERGGSYFGHGIFGAPSPVVFLLPFRLADLDRLQG